MAAKGPLRGIKQYALHQLVANYWSLPLIAVFGAPLIGALVLWADRQFAAQWLFERGVTLPVAGDTAQDLAIAIVGVNAALLTLYWSVTLIVLTLATGNLGVRLVDRWLDKVLTRVSVAGLTFCLVFSIAVLTRIDPESGLSELPHFALAVLFALELVNIAMLGVAIHDLGRTMFVDRSIAHLGTEASSIAVPIVPAEPFTGKWSFTLNAPREGYVEGIDLARLCKRLGSEGHIRLCAAPGQHVLMGEPLVRFEHEPETTKPVLRAIAIGDYRSSVQSTVYQVRLLVEVAARALSPGINDFYTALACADQLAAAMAGHARTWVDDGLVPAYEHAPRFELPGQDFRGLFEKPLKGFRQAAADYPSVSIRMIENYCRLCALLEARNCPEGMLAFLRQCARDLRDQAMACAQFESDRADIAQAFGRMLAEEGNGA